MKSTMMGVPLSLNHVLERAGRIYPDSEIVSRLPDKSLRRHTYAQFHQRARALAAALLAAGLRKGERVATLCWNHHAHLEAYFGIPAAGGVCHTLNLRLSPEDIGWIAAHAQDRFLIVDDVMLPLYEQFKGLHRFEKVIVFPFSGKLVPPGFVDYEAFLRSAPAEFEYVAHEEDDAISMCYTSGTTGRPKGVAYSHRSTLLHTLVASLPDHLGLSGRDAILPVTPMFHANAWGVPYAGVMMGAKMIFPGPHLHPADLLDLMHQEPPTVSLGVPTIWLSVIQTHEAHPGRWQLPAGMRSMVGGSAVPESLIRGYARHGIELRQGWGMTETSPLASLSYIKSELANVDDDQAFALRATAGVPAPLVEFRIIGNDGQPCAWNGRDVGEVQVRGPYITGDYYELPRDPEKFSDGWLRTGDVASLDEHAYLRISDRTKDLIKSGGEWISSVDLENAIMGHPAVAEAAVIAIAHPKWDERPLACVVRKSGAQVTADELRDYLAGRFARWQLPDAIEFIDAVPRTSTGKFWKARLRDMYRDWHWPQEARQQA